MRMDIPINVSKFHKDRLKDHVAIIHENVRGYSVRSTWQRQETAPLMYIRSTHFAWSESRARGIVVRPAGSSWTAESKNGNISLAIAVTASQILFYFIFYFFGLPVNITLLLETGKKIRRQNITRLEILTAKKTKKISKEKFVKN